MFSWFVMDDIFMPGRWYIVLWNRTYLLFKRASLRAYTCICDIGPAQLHTTSILSLWHWPVTNITVQTSRKLNNELTTNSRSSTAEWRSESNKEPPLVKLSIFLHYIYTGAFNICVLFDWFFAVLVALNYAWQVHVFNYKIVYLIH